MTKNTATDVKSDRGSSAAPLSLPHGWLLHFAELKQSAGKTRLTDSGLILQSSGLREIAGNGVIGDDR